MGTCAALRERGGDVEITHSAIRAYGRLLAVFGPRLRTHGHGDGGLICEDRTNRARPLMWLIAADGSITPDTRYSYRHRAFVPAAAPQGV